MTENHGYNVPSEGTTDWHIPLNENFRDFDKDIELRGKKANISDYAPTEGSKFFAVDTREVFTGDGSNWNKLGVLPELGNEIESQIRVFGASSAGSKVYREDHHIDDFSDIGDAIQTAHDNLINAGHVNGGAIELPVGKYDLSSPVEINIPVTLSGKGGSDWRRNVSGELGVNTRLNWVGDSANMFTLRASDDSLMGNPGHVPGVHFEGLLLTNDGGNATSHIKLDGTSGSYSNGSLIPKLTMDRVTVAGATGPEIHAVGTVFQGSFQNLTVVTENGRGLVIEDSSDSVAGGPSQFYFYNPFLYSDGANYSADVTSQQIGIFGGTIANRGGGEGVRLGYRGSVWATNIEGDTSSGTTGAVLWGGGPWHFHPATCSKWGSGLSVGDPDNKARVASRVRFSFATRGNASQDVIIQDGSQRNNWTPMIDGLNITDKRLEKQSTNEKNSVVLANHTDTTVIPVDTVQQVSTRVKPLGQANYETFDCSVISTDDGSGGNVSDFALGTPIAQDLSNKRIDVIVPVTKASGAAGAEATLQFEFKRYT